MKTFGVIISCFNAEENLERAIKALIQNQFLDQIVIFDDGSTDKTKDIILKYEKIEQVEIFLSKKNLGTVNAINLMLGKVKTDYVLFASSSDQISQKVVEEARKDIFKFGSCGLWTAKAAYLENSYFDKYELPVPTPGNSKFIKNPYKYFCKFGVKFEGSTGFFNTNLAKKYTLNRGLLGLADLILGLQCSLDKGLIINNNVFSKVKKNDVGKGYLEKTYKYNQLSDILNLIKKEFSKLNNDINKDNHDRLYKVISSQIKYGFLNRKYIKLKNIPEKYIFLITLIKLYISRSLYSLNKKYF